MTEPELVGNAAAEEMGFSKEDIDEEKVKQWPPSTVCKWVVSTALPEAIGKHFIEHSINGELLLRLTFEDMNKIGVTNVGDEFALWDRIVVLQRVCNKPDTQEMTVPSIPARLVKLLTFAFADTSEGKSTDDMKGEVVGTCGNVAVISTLVWAIAFDIFYNSAYSTFCETNALKTIESFCLTSGGFDLDGWRLTVFYCFGGLCSVSLLFSTIFAVVQIIMVYEMSDEVELEIFLDLMGFSQMLPGIFLLLGLGFLFVPMTIFLVFNSMNGNYYQTMNLIDDDPKYDVTNLIMSYVTTGAGVAMILFAVGHAIPAYLGNLYECKVQAMKADVDMIVGNFKDLDLGDDHF